MEEVQNFTDSARTQFHQKLQTLTQLHSFCREREIPYFAVRLLAQLIHNPELLTQERALSEWTVGTLRNGFCAFREQARSCGFLVDECPDGSVAVRLAQSDVPIYMEVYDAVPSRLAAQKQFLETVAEKREAYRNAPDAAAAQEAYAALTTLAQSQQEDSHGMVAPLLRGDGAPFSRALLYPLKNRRFFDCIVSVGADSTIWTVTEPQPLAVRRLEVLRRVDRLCRRAGMPYFAISKLDISSRMYGDLMPEFGESAMEIGMMRRDFEKLSQLLAEDPGEFVVYRTDANGVRNGKLRVTIQAFAGTDGQPEEILQVLPYDFLPDTEVERKQFLSELRTLYAAYRGALRYDREHPEQTPTAPPLYESIRKAATRYDGPQTQTGFLAYVELDQSKVLKYNQVFPVVDDKMGDFEICCTANPFLWAQSANPFYNEAANQGKTEILKRLNRLCDANGITWFAIADLLIGAVTYHDYVPDKPEANWDVALLRKDYTQLVQLLRASAGEYGLELREYRDAAKHFPQATKSLHLPDSDWNTGAIRLIPFDKIPEVYDTRYAFAKKVDRLNKLFRQLTDYGLTGKCSLSQKEIRKARKKYGPDALNALYRRIDSLAQTYNGDGQTHQYGRIALEKSKYIPEKELFPLAQTPFRDIAIRRPADYSVWTPVIDEALHTQVKSIQQADLILIDKLDEICRKLDIGYFVCGGSMLGYMRHGGFIPWDDDVDVAMLRKDYDRFLAEAPQYLDSRFFLQTRKSDPTIPYLFSKLRLNNTEYVTKYNERRPFHKGICLDNFPFDNIPNEPKGRVAIKKEVARLSRAHNRIVNNQMPDPIDPIRPRNLREVYYRGYGMLKRLYFFCHSLKRSQKKYLAKATSLNDRAEALGLDTVASFVPSYTYIRIDDLLPYRDVTFEGHRIKVPNHPEVFLQMQYGDYLQLPPKHEQVAHRLVRWSVDLKADAERRAANSQGTEASV